MGSPRAILDVSADPEKCTRARSARPAIEPKYAGDPEIATRRMQEINEAYGVLSDPEKRRQYDAERGDRVEDADSYFEEQRPEASAADDPLQKSWSIATGFYPDLVGIVSGLEAYSWRLAFAFRAHLLECQKFEQRFEISENLKKKFLETYFGKNPHLQRFADTLISGGDRNLARQLNQAICVLGEVKDPLPIMKKIVADAQGDDYDKFGIAYAQDLDRTGYWYYGGERFRSFNTAFAFAQNNHQRIYGDVSQSEWNKARAMESDANDRRFLHRLGLIAVVFVLIGLLVVAKSR
jgi:curved DNA-binding protein CbpA